MDSEVVFDYSVIGTVMAVDVSLSNRSSADKQWSPLPLHGDRAPRAKYTVVGETLRYVIPGHVQCSMGCGGRACKYEDPTRWSDSEQAITGLYSSWVTDNLLAMARPSTEIIEKCHIIDQFKRCGLKTLINLQRPGEHASCGNPLETESGFTYRPEVFMENEIYFYNFGWNDYGVSSHSSILDMVKVMAFAMQEGKMAVHCHAGLGRTGVLLACFLVFATRMTANQAIVFVRAKRPNSIQTRGQLICVREFAQFLVPLRSVFSRAEPQTDPVTLSQYLTRQRQMLHGYERRQLRHLPKIIQLVCRLLLDIADNCQVIEEDTLEVPDITAEMEWAVGRESITHISFAIGDPGDPPRLPGAPAQPRHANEPPLFYHRKSLSYSDSDLRRLGSELNLLSPTITTVSQNSLPVACSPNPNPKPNPLSTQSSGSDDKQLSVSIPEESLWCKKFQEGSPLLKKTKKRPVQRSGSAVLNTYSMGTLLSRWKEEQRAELTVNGKLPHGDEEEEEDKSEVPFITILSELSLEAKRMLVAQALAVDLAKDGQEEHRRRVSIWQAELNLGAAWERLCMERDPFILAGLMWAWLEQLSEPVISTKAAQTLDPNNDNPQTVLNSLDQAPRESLVCILDCMANMLTIPEEVEVAFLDRTIKAFTQLGKSSEAGKSVYATMTEVIRLLLHKMRDTAEAKAEGDLVVPLLPTT